VGDSRSWDDAVLSVCCTQCMLYLVYAVLGVNSGSLHRGTDRNDLTSCSLVMVEIERDERKWGKSG